MISARIFGRFETVRHCLVAQRRERTCRVCGLIVCLQGVEVFQLKLMNFDFTTVSTRIDDRSRLLYEIEWLPTYALGNASWIDFTQRRIDETSREDTDR